MSSLTVHGLTDVGCVRANNEDNLLVDTIAPGLHFMAVIDGVGGHAGGEIASQSAVDAFAELIRDGKLKTADDPAVRELLLEMAVQRAHISISRRAQDNPALLGMACAATALIATGDDFSFAQVGDTACYHWSPDTGAKQLSIDQTIAQQLYERGQIGEAELETHPDRHVLAQALGVEAIASPLQAAVTTAQWLSGDRLLLCSDGLNNMVSLPDITQVLSEEASVVAAAENLIARALDAGGRDNVTVIVAENS